MSRTVTLPDAEPQNPTCGACIGELSHDGDGFVCYDCGLYFDPVRLEASYLDDEAEPCGEPCANEWHEPDRLRPGSRWECSPCSLPEGHGSDTYPPIRSGHWEPCRPIIDKEATE